jgi:O-antigen/teichoic acid export membrane protein
MTKLRQFFSGDALSARLARGGAVALIVRLLSVALSYFMFVVLARHMTEDDFGRFGFAFSFATFVAVVAAFGQPMLMLRLIPTYQDNSASSLLNGLVRESRIILLIGIFASALLMLIGSFIWARVTETDPDYLLWSVILMAGMAVAQHQAFVLRAFGKIVLAMTPRDIFWRIAVIVIIVFVAEAQAPVSASRAVNICSFSLLMILAIQVLAHSETHPGVKVQKDVKADRSLWAKGSAGLWAVTIVQASGPNLSVVVLGLILSPEEIGPFFAALKTATILALPLAAGVIVAAPLISRHYHAGQIREVQLISSYLVIGATAPVLIGFVLVVLFGNQILGLFGPDFVSARSALILVAFGTLVNALSGPTAFIMNMTGHHRQFLVIMCITQFLTLMILPIAAYYYGTGGAGATVAGGMILWNVWVWQWSRKNILVDPTLYGVGEWILGRSKVMQPSDEKT